MNRKLGKGVCVLLAMVLLLSLLPACGQATEKPGESSATSGNASQQAGGEEDLSPITFTALDYNGEKEWGTDAISQEITKATGVTLEYLPVGNNGSEKLIILLASGEIPDLIREGLFSATENKYVAADALLPLDELVEQYGQDIRKEVSDEYLDLMRSQHNGKLFALPCWYTRPFVGSGNGALMMRKDILAEFAPDKAAGEGYFTFDEYMELLKKVKDKYPDMTGYLPNGENLEWWVLWAFRGFQGIYNYSVQGDQVKLYYRDPKMLESYKLLNEIVRSGYADPEWATIKTESFYQKSASGKVFSTSSAYWDMMAPSAVLEKEGKGQFLPYKLVGPDADPAKLTLGGTNMLGWDGIMIGKNVKSPERMMKFLNYMASEKGQLLSWFGIEGTNWDRVNGEVTPKEDVLTAYKAGGETWDAWNKNVGIAKWEWMVRSSSPDRFVTIKDYLAKKEKKNELEAMAAKTLSDTAYAQDIFIGIEPDANTPEDLIAQKCKDIFMESSIAIINAKSEEQCTERYAKMMKDLEDAGVEKVEKILTDKFNARRTIFGWK